MVVDSCQKEKRQGIYDRLMMRSGEDLGAEARRAGAGATLGVTSYSVEYAI